MPRYFFHVHDGQEFCDETGADLHDLAAARQMAIRLSGDLLRDQEADFWNEGEWRMDVTDGRGLVLFTLAFNAYDAPTLRRE